MLISNPFNFNTQARRMLKMGLNPRQRHHRDTLPATLTAVPWGLPVCA